MMLRLVLVMIAIWCEITWAKPSGGGTGGSGKDHTGKRLSVLGFYGLGGVNPSDINNISSAASTVPPLQSISTLSYFGGGIGYQLSRKFQTRLTYEKQEAKNLVTATTPSVTDAGYTISWTELWAEINYNLTQSRFVYAYLGAGFGYPIESHLTANLSSRTEYDAEKTLGYKGQAGFGILLGKYVSIFFQTEFQSLASGDVKDSGGTALNQSNSSTHAKLDMSGPKAHVGMAIHF